MQIGKLIFVLTEICLHWSKYFGPKMSQTKFLQLTCGVLMELKSFSLFLAIWSHGGKWSLPWSAIDEGGLDIPWLCTFVAKILLGLGDDMRDNLLAFSKY